MEDVNIIRVEKQKDFVVINREFCENKNLSLKAKGLLAYLLSLPDNWKIYVSELTKHHKDGKDSIKSVLRELIENKYIHREKVRENGKFKGYRYRVFEKPVESTFEPKADFPFTGKPFTEKPSTGNPQLINNNLTKDNNINKYKHNKHGKPKKDDQENVVCFVDVFLKNKNIVKGNELYEPIFNIISAFNKITGKKPCERDVITAYEIIISPDGSNYDIKSRETIIISVMQELQNSYPDKKINSVNYFKKAILNKFSSTKSVKKSSEVVVNEYGQVYNFSKINSS